MKKAWSLIRSQPWYRAQAFTSGLSAAGFSIQSGAPKGSPGDVLLHWNRYGHVAQIAEQFERDGGTTLCAENGYINADGSSPKFAVHNKVGPRPQDYYSLGIGFHNDSTRIKIGDAQRWRALGLEVKPWRTAGDHILICPNRSFGVPWRMMKLDWADKTAERLRTETKREVRIRRHPGNNAPQRPLLEDLKNAWAVVIWSSTSGVHALVDGIPVICEAPAWICKGASLQTLKGVELLNEPEIAWQQDQYRQWALQHMAWGQWQCRELESGEPFRRLLS